VTTRAAVGLWTPSNETVQGIGDALCAHWAAAKKVAASSPFFRAPANWLAMSRRHLMLQPVRVTSQLAPAMAAMREAAGMKRNA
jgi:hypothetical protein